MPDKRRHRGPHPEDRRLFAQEALPRLRAAASDLAWLLSRSYAPKSALKLVGDRHELTQRQRIAVARSVCSDEVLCDRRRRHVSAERLRGETLLVDGYNVLTTVEAALAGGVVLAARDGAYRDMASVHGTFRKVSETLPALELLGRCMSALGVAGCRWYLDQPVSNSGRLKALIQQIAVTQGHTWEVQLVVSPDRVLMGAAGIVATADSVIIDRCGRWTALARHAVEALVPNAAVIELARPSVFHSAQPEETSCEPNSEL